MQKLINTQTGVFAFTATGPICAGGSFIDATRVAAGHPDTSGRFNVVTHTVYTCTDGSRTFNALKLQRITVGDTGFAGTGPIQILGGTGPYARLAGHGVDDGSCTFETRLGVGNISGFITRP